MNFRGSIARPVLSPVNASAHPLRHAPDDSRSAWFATPSLCDSFIHYAMPVSRRFRLFSCALTGLGTGPTYSPNGLLTCSLDDRPCHLPNSFAGFSPGGEQ